MFRIPALLLGLIACLPVYSQVAADSSTVRPALHKVPFLSRFIPGITFQVQNQANVACDINPSLQYRITPRFTAGAGVNYRLTFVHGHTNGSAKIFGPRISLQFGIARGFSVRAVPEAMSLVTQNNPLGRFIPEQRHRIWASALFLGIKKDFRVYRAVHGNVEGLANVSGGNTRVYADRFVVRFGIEFQLSKRKLTN